MDLGTIIGIIVGITMVVVSILLSGSLSSFWDVPSLAIVLGGTLASTMVAFPLKSVMAAGKAAISVFFGTRIDHVETVRTILRAANAVRKDGALALEKMKVDKSFMQTAFQLVADGMNPEDVGHTLTIEMEAAGTRQAEIVKVLEKMAELAPAWGMVGTLIGLVIMLLKLDDPKAIGPAMSVAILTTFYGALLANFLLGPSATKLEERSEREQEDYRLVMEGAIGMARNENPRTIQQRLLGFMPPTDRAALSAQARAKKKS